MSTAHLADSLADEMEVVLETRAGPDGPRHATIIWVVVIDERAYVRTVNGPASRWYREALAHPDCALIAAGERFPVTVVAVDDTATVDAVSAAYLAKYAGDRSARLMVKPEVLGTTLELRPGVPFES
jgi:hypothetical protein